MEVLQLEDGGAVIAQLGVWGSNPPKLTNYRYDTVNKKTQLAIINERPSLSIKYRSANTLSMMEADGLNGGPIVLPYLSARDASDPFPVIVLYDKVDKLAKVFEGSAGDTDFPAYDPARYIKIGSKMEPEDGGEETLPATTSGLKLDMEASGAVEIDWDYYTIALTLTGDITSWTDINMSGNDGNPGYEGTCMCVQIKTNGFSLAGLPSYYTKTSGSFEYDSTKTMKMVLHCIEDTAGNEEVDYTYDMK